MILYCIGYARVAQNIYQILYDERQRGMKNGMRVLGRMSRSRCALETRAPRWPFSLELRDGARTSDLTRRPRAWGRSSPFSALPAPKLPRWHPTRPATAAPFRAQAGYDERRYARRRLSAQLVPCAYRSVSSRRLCYRRLGGTVSFNNSKQRLRALAIRSLSPAQQRFRTVTIA